MTGPSASRCRHCQHPDQIGLVLGVMLDRATTGITRCAVCARFASDIDAAFALLEWLGTGEVRFWQHDRLLLDPSGQLPQDHPDLAEHGFRIRSYGAGQPRRPDDQVLIDTAPWVSVRGRAVHWDLVDLIISRITP